MHPFVLIPILIYALFTIPALVWLGRRGLDEVAQAIWALIVVSVPVMGAVALILVSPGAPRAPEAKADPGFELDEFRRQ